MAFMAAVGPILSGVMGFMQASYQAKIADMNADVAKDNANRAIEKSQVQEQDQAAQTSAMLGAQEAAQSASGLSINSDTARRVRRAARVLGRKDVLNVRQAGEIEKYNYLVDAANFEAQGKMVQLGGIGSLLSGFVQAGGSMVGNAPATGASANYPKPYAKPRLIA